VTFRNVSVIGLIETFEFAAVAEAPPLARDYAYSLGHGNTPVTTSFVP